MGSIWRFKWRRTKWVWFWVWRWWLNAEPGRIAKTLPNHNHDFPEIRMVKKGTSAFFAPIHATVPKSGKPFFWKQECLKKGHPHVQKAAEDSPENSKSFFPETRNPVLGTIARGFCPFLQYGAILTLFMLNYLRPYMLSQKWLQKSSANYLVPRGFAQKGFAISIFGHFFCPFPENFIESCRVKTKNNNFKL